MQQQQRTYSSFKHDINFFGQTMKDYLKKPTIRKYTKPKLNTEINLMGFEHTEKYILVGWSLVAWYKNPRNAGKTCFLSNKAICNRLLLSGHSVCERDIERAMSYLRKEGFLYTKLKSRADFKPCERFHKREIFINWKVVNPLLQCFTSTALAKIKSIRLRKLARKRPFRDDTNLAEIWRHAYQAGETNAKTPLQMVKQWAITVSSRYYNVASYTKNKIPEGMINRKRLEEAVFVTGLEDLKARATTLGMDYDKIVEQALAEGSPPAPVDDIKTNYLIAVKRHLKNASLHGLKLTLEDKSEFKKANVVTKGNYYLTHASPAEAIQLLLQSTSMLNTSTIDEEAEWEED